MAYTFPMFVSIHFHLRRLFFCLIGGAYVCILLCARVYSSHSCAFLFLSYIRLLCRCCPSFSSASRYVSVLLSCISVYSDSLTLYEVHIVDFYVFAFVFSACCLIL